MRLKLNDFLPGLSFTCNYVVSVERGFLFLGLLYFIVALPGIPYNYFVYLRSSNRLRSEIYQVPFYNIIECIMLTRLCNLGP